MHPLLTIALRAARKAGNIITRSAERLDTIEISQKSKNDFVTDVDRQAEDIIIETIKQAYPSHGILAEESGTTPGDEFTWIIDPIDGTTNFIHGFPQFAISIAVQNKDRIEHALIFDPMRQETFTASRGEGARLNDRRIRVSKCNELHLALLGTGFPFRGKNLESQHLDTYFKTLKTFVPLTNGIRRTGSAVLDLAYVATGRLDGFWEFGLSPWDIAAGMLLIQEAGGLTSDPYGHDDHFKTGDIVAGNPKIFKAMLQAMRPCLLED